MPGNASLLINKQKIENFKSFSVQANLYRADAGFQMELSNPETTIVPAQRCELQINGITELNGIIDKTEKKYSKEETSFSIEGRSLMGLLVDSYCEKFITLPNVKLKDLTNTLLKNVPYINRKNIVYQQDVAGSMKSKRPPLTIFSDADNPQALSQILPNMTIFDVLKQYSMSQGLLFYNLPDGTFVFGTPKSSGSAVFSIVLKKDGKNNNAKSVHCIQDYSRRYSKVVVTRQMQGTDMMGIPDLNDEYPLPDPTFPFYKPFVTQNEFPTQTLKHCAAMIMDHQKHDSFRLMYKVPGFSQNGKNWAINELCHVVDEINGLDDTYLIYGRTFELSKSEGAQTTLQLGYKGGKY